MAGFLGSFLDWGWLWLILGLFIIPALKRLPELLVGLIDLLADLFS